MKNFDTRVYNIADFVEWNNRDQLELSPDFQRRSVWSLQAKSYLVDTIIRGKPMPKLLLMQESRDRRNIRIVVDGQQRLRAILEFVDGDFAISRAHNKEYAGKRFEALPPEVQSEYLKYEIGVDLIYDLPFGDILDIFARLNTYTVKLSPQELLNAKYVGFFKQLAYRTGYRYVDYFLAGKILTKSNVARMSEAELTSDLLTTIIDGIQSNKNVESMYKTYEERFDNIDQYEERFDEIMRVVYSIYKPAEIATTNWSRVHLFFTLFISLYNLRFGIGGLKNVRIKNFSQSVVSRIRFALDDLSERYDRYTAKDFDQQHIPENFLAFITSARRGTTDTGARVYRSDFVCHSLVESIANS